MLLICALVFVALVKVYEPACEPSSVVVLPTTKPVSVLDVITWFPSLEVEPEIVTVSPTSKVSVISPTIVPLTTIVSSIAVTAIFVAVT